MDCVETMPATDEADAAPAGRAAEQDVTVVVPTYTEAANLPLLVPRLAAALTGAGLHGEIVIVDDDSPDATEPICRELALSYPVRLIVRRGERGLAGAVLCGLRQARGTVLVVMDADLSHPPETVPALVAAVRDGAEFAIGSRYVRGGSTDADWGVWRRLNSWTATLLALPLARARDPLAGLFALRRDTFAAGGPFDPVGFKIGLELLVKCRCRRVREVPIAFRDRTRGASKLTLRERLDYLRHLARLYRWRLFGPSVTARGDPTAG